MLKRWQLRWALAIVCLTWGLAAQALNIEKLDDGTPYIVGGVTKDERKEIESLRRMFNMWVQTAASPSGSYLSDVKVTVTNAQGQTVFDQTLDGPWLMAKLPEGRYRINAVYESQTIRRDVKVLAEKMEPVYFHFNVP
jgi:hypothetical protein